MTSSQKLKKYIWTVVKCQDFHFFGKIAIFFQQNKLFFFFLGSAATLLVVFDAAIVQLYSKHKGVLNGNVEWKGIQFFSGRFGYFRHFLTENPMKSNEFQSKGLILLHLYNGLSSHVEAFTFVIAAVLFTVHGTRTQRCLTQWAIPCNCVCNSIFGTINTTISCLCEWNPIPCHMATCPWDRDLSLKWVQYPFG